jgi:hypothetical protein
MSTIPGPLPITSSDGCCDDAAGAAPPNANNTTFVRGSSLEDSGANAAPSLEAARAYGQMSRPMRIRDPHQPSGYRLARVGEARPAAKQGKKTALGGHVARVADAAGGEQERVGGGPPKAEPYSFVSTHLQQLDEFGIGVALYFRQLTFLALLFLGAGLLYIPTLWHNYRHVNGPDTPWLLLGSSLGAEREDLSLTYHGAVDLAVCAFLLCFAVASKKVEDAAATAIDTAQQTTQDYAIEVLNAPKATTQDLDAYAEYFRRWGEVVFVTVALDNGRLLRLLRRRRELRALLSTTVEGVSLLEAERSGASLESLRPEQPSFPKQLLYRLGLYSHGSLVAAEYLSVKAQVAAEAAQAQRPGHLSVKRVYVVFNTEAAQRACLEAHLWGLLDRARHALGLGRGLLLFKGVALLRVQEPVEPSEIHYEAWEVRAWQRGLRYAVSTLLAATSLGVSYALLSLAQGRALYTALVTSGALCACAAFCVCGMCGRRGGGWCGNRWVKTLITRAHSFDLDRSLLQLLETKTNPCRHERRPAAGHEDDRGRRGGAHRPVGRPGLGAAEARGGAYLCGRRDQGTYVRLRSSGYSGNSKRLDERRGASLPSFLSLRPVTLPTLKLSNIPPLSLLLLRQYLVTDYADTMSASTLGAIVSILIADAFTNPVLSVLNIPGRFKQWVLAPRAKSQREMNLYFAGSDWSLAERYTDLIKTAFLSLFWSSILPGGCFLTALAFFIVSYTVRACLPACVRALRACVTWERELDRGRQKGKETSKFLIKAMDYHHHHTTTTAG